MEDGDVIKSTVADTADSYSCYPASWFLMLSICIIFVVNFLLWPIAYELFAPMFQEASNVYSQSTSPYAGSAAVFGVMLGIILLFVGVLFFVFSGLSIFALLFLSIFPFSLLQSSLSRYGIWRWKIITIISFFVLGVVGGVYIDGIWIYLSNVQWLEALRKYYPEEFSQGLSVTFTISLLLIGYNAIRIVISIPTNNKHET